MLALSTKPWLSYNFQGKNHCPWLRIFLCVSFLGPSLNWFEVPQ